mmetsp:Transcript_12758/g.18764  ORF Transcript_12758/g.18764 Transcript_12758/m.18764 type:complete len:319 (+) Transcript_12758:309-1265(+)
MRRYEIKNGPISIIYGHEPSTGVFLSVVDSRLKYDSEAADEVNKVSRCAVGIEGSYLDLYTGRRGIGLQVDDTTMACFLERYGVTRLSISALPLSIQHEDSLLSLPNCALCHFTATKHCKGCQEVTYCSRECQSQDWLVHKIFCQIEEDCPNDLGNNNANQRFVQALLLPESGDDPRFVYLPLTPDEEDVDCREFIPDDENSSSSRYRSDKYSKKLNPKWDYQIIYKDDDYDRKNHQHVNASVDRIQKAKLKVMSECAGNKDWDEDIEKMPVYWRNVVLVVKTNKEDQKYEDVTLLDVSDISEFLVKAGIKLSQGNGS